MKKLTLILMIIVLSLVSKNLVAQVSFGVNIGVPSRYFYLQDIEAYYDNNTHMYIYQSGSRWIHARNLPSSYGNYDLEHGHKVYIKDYRGNRPYGYYNDHKTKFPKGHYENEGKNSWSHKEYKEEGRKNRSENRGNNGNGRGNNGNGRGNGQENHGNGKGR